MKDISYSTTSPQDTFLSNEASDDNTSSLSLSQRLQQQLRANRESLLLDDGDDHPLCNERLSMKDVPWYGQQGEQYAPDASTPKVHQPEAADTSDFGLGPKMLRHISQGTPPPPPPSNRSKPGAIHIPGFQAESNTAMIMPAIESTSFQSEPTKSPTPILQASVVVNEEQEQPSSPGETLPVLAEPMNDNESTKNSFCDMLKERRQLTMILMVLVVTIIAFAIGVIMVIMNKETITTTTVEYIPATPAPIITTLDPSAAPTKALESFPPPSLDQCLQIEAGNEVANQDELILKTYQIELDVVVESNQANLMASLITTTLVTRMQETLAPKLAQCDNNMFDHDQRRRLRGMHHRKLLLVSDYLVGNAKFSSSPTVASNRSCKKDDGALQPTYCYKVSASVDLYIKHNELDVRVISLIIDAFDGESLVELLDFGPFKSIDMIGVTSSMDAPNDNNTIQDDSPDDDDED